MDDMSWAEALAQRLMFFARGRSTAGLAPALAALRARTASPAGNAVLRAAFLRACLDVLDAPELAALRAMAREALAGDCDDRALNRLAAPLVARPGAVGFAARVPGRVVWLAAMARALPDEETAAAAMLADDLAAAGADLPFRALQLALNSTG